MKFPAIIIDQYGSARAFKATKRRQAQVVLRAIDDLRVGCAYLPTGSRLLTILQKAAEDLARELSVKRWGR